MASEVTIKPPRHILTQQQLLKVSLLVWYVAAYLLIFFREVVENTSIFLFTLPVTAVSLWFGPLALIGAQGRRKLYDPATIFNLAIFYYVIKGIPLAWSTGANFVGSLDQYHMIRAFPSIAFFVLMGTLAWNFAYEIVMDITPKHSTGRVKLTERLSERGFGNISLGILLLTVIGLISFFLLLRPVGGNIFVFLTNPLMRAYLTSATYGTGSSLGYFWFYGVNMFPVASLLWLVSYGVSHRNPTGWWWIHTITGLGLVFLVSPRTNLIAFVLSLLLVYHLVICKINTLVLILSGASVFAYASLTRLWRSIVGTMNTPTMQAGLTEISRNLNLKSFLDIVGSTNLADIRIFLLIENFYGRTLPLKYGETLLRVVTQLVPRALWPSKPLDLGVEIGRLLDPNTLSGSPPGFFGEMYLNFHFFGVIIGGAFLGVGLALLYKQWMVLSRNALTIVLYALLAPRIFVVVSSTLANIVLGILLLSSSVFFATIISQKPIVSSLKSARDYYNKVD